MTRSKLAACLAPLLFAVAASAGASSPARNDAPTVPVRSFIAGLYSSNIYSAAGQRVSQGAGGTATSPLADPTRPPEDLERDPGSRPLEVFAWLGIADGMTVGDLVPFGGYNTHLLSRVVGPQGTVYAVYNIARQQAAFDERMANAELGNVVELAELSSVADDSVDAYVTVRNMHDFYIPEIVDAVDLADRETVFGEALRTLKPGGILGVVDSRTDKEGVDPETHRINEATVVAELESLGFELVDRSDLLADPTDDYSASNFPVRWNNDRFLLKFRKPRRGSPN